MVQHEIKQDVRESMKIALEQYQLMNSLADQMLTGNLPPDQWQDTADMMKRVSLGLENLKQIDQTTVSNHRDRCSQASSEMAQIKDQLALSMQALLMKVSRLEQQAVKSKQALLPQINAGVKVLQMKSAYGKYA
jgi:hypothetical protein